MLEFIYRELDRIDNGYHFYNAGDITWLPPAMYLYLAHWTLENGEPPEYREPSRRWFTFRHQVKNHVLHTDGIIRTKKRREGATSEETCCQVHTAIRTKLAFIGNISKSGKDAKDIFIKMIKPGFLGLPIFLKPTHIEDPDSQTSLVFLPPKKRVSKTSKSTSRRRGSIYDDAKGNGSRIDWRNTELNSYDSGRITDILIDEGGKWPADVPINEYWPIVQQTLRRGGRRVGFAVLPSTVNKLTRGGRGFKILWDDSNQFESEYTGSRLYRYFTPADEGYEPFIDRHGRSIKTTPTKEQAKWMREHYGADELQCSMGATDYIKYQIDLIRDENMRNEFRRMYPLTEKDAFDFDDNTNIYNVNNVRNQKERVLEVRPAIKRVKFTRDHEGKATYVLDENGPWYMLRDPKPEERNAVGKDAFGKPKPGNTHLYAGSADPFKNDIVIGPGSKGAGFIWSKPNALDPENTGMPIAMYYDRPRRKKEMHEQMLLACEFFGCQMAYESDIDDYLGYLEDESKMHYAMLKPKNVIDPNKKKTEKKKKQFGVKAGDRFQLATMLDASVEFVDFHCGKIWFMMLLEQLEEYDNEERTQFDLAAAFQVGCVAIADPVAIKKVEALTKIKYIKTYTN